MSINKKLLQDHHAKYRMARDTLGEFHRQLFTMHPDIAKYYDAEDIDPDSIPKAQKFQRTGQVELRNFFELADSLESEKEWRISLNEMANYYEETGVPLAEFKKYTEPFLKAMEKNAGGLSGEQRKHWTLLFDKAAQFLRDK